MCYSMLKHVDCENLDNRISTCNEGHDLSCIVISNTSSWCADEVFDMVVIDGAWQRQSLQAGAAWIGMDHNGTPIFIRRLSFLAPSALVAEARACMFRSFKVVLPMSN
ncbi:hypothetical protein LOK49_LG06G02297 [Camellia lanceoleosa]|uniref:Uncharacterized protein n=1 Tax=Camellia lanceoleosa TaxID=1840588 RepID=A0ACC0HD83_9ERIC|nr:hypothetical protein LOK49_LG06G02297 [Camellia lanceoleosa]